MLKKVYHLATCDTNQRMLKEIDFGKDVDFQDIKEQNIDEETLDFFKEKWGSYEALFSKRARKFRAMQLNEVKLTEEDYKRLMLEEYTFLKRPFIRIGNQTFVGSSKRTIEMIKEAYRNTNE